MNGTGWGIIGWGVYFSDQEHMTGDTSGPTYNPLNRTNIKCPLLEYQYIIWYYEFVLQELLTLPKHPSLPPDFCGVRVTRSLLLCFVDRCLSFFFGNCVVCSSIYGFWLPLWYFSKLLTINDEMNKNTTLSEHLQNAIEKEANSIRTQMYDRSLHRLGRGTSIKSGWIKLMVWPILIWVILH